MPGRVAAQARPADSTAAGADSAKVADRAWYERLSLRGYVQARYNQLARTNADLECAQCDRSIGRDGGLFLRRAATTASPASASTTGRAPTAPRRTTGCTPWRA